MRDWESIRVLALGYDSLIWMKPVHAYQSLACETAINTEFSELFSPKHIHVKYKNAILSLIDLFFRTWKD